MSNLVFITGGSGHIGSRVIIDALQAGYEVRAAVRSQQKADKIKAMPSLRALNAGSKLSFFVVPDLLVDGAYDEAIKGATYVIHLASPISDAHKEGESYQTTLIEPAVKGTLNILEAAKKARSIRRVVITASCVSTIPWKDFTSGSSSIIFNEASRTPLTQEPYDNSFEAYAASKVAAFNETESWLAKEKANISFDVINILPGFVIGKDELVTEASDALRGTNMPVLGPVTGNDAGYTPSASVHLLDVASAHVKSLDSKVPGNQSYLLVAQDTKWEDTLDIVARNFPAAVKAGTLANNGKNVTLPVKIDASASEKALGFKFRGFEEQVKDVVQYYLELVEGSK
jgi:nucleoside-diphosphate-sugar epimerase